MNIHEYQAKALFREYAIPVPHGAVVTSTEQAADVATSLGGSRWVVKAQVHAGGRGKAGGVKLVLSAAEVAAAVTGMLGTCLVTHQTSEQGQPINDVLIEMPSEIQGELYLGALVDRSRERIVFMASAAGGMDIEEVARDHPEQLHSIYIDPVVGLQDYQCRQIVFALGLTQHAKQLTHIMHKLYRLFVDKDLSLVEINPLVVTPDGLMAI